MKRALSADTIVDLFAVCAIGLAAASVTWSVHSRRSSAGYRVGERFIDVPEVDLNQSSGTLFVWTSSLCPACTSSMPFYRELASAPRRARIVVVGLEPIEILREFLADHGVSVDQVVSVGHRAVLVTRTPTLVLVSRNGVIEEVWSGRFEQRREEEAVLSRLQRE